MDPQNGVLKWNPSQNRKLLSLVRQTMMLADALPAQGFASSRVAYLGKHVKAMETLCRKLSGEHFSIGGRSRILPGYPSRMDS